MKHQYFAPLCEEIKVSATSELLTGSPAPVGGLFLNVTGGSGDVTAE